MDFVRRWGSIICYVYWVNRFTEETMVHSNAILQWLRTYPEISTKLASYILAYNSTVHELCTQLYTCEI